MRRCLNTICVLPIFFKEVSVIRMIAILSDKNEIYIHRVILGQITTQRPPKNMGIPVSHSYGKKFDQNLFNNSKEKRKQNSSLKKFNFFP